jgi:hypothetical protein
MEQLQARASAALQWDAFWNRSDRYNNYVPNKQVSAVAFLADDEAMLFVPDVRSILVFGIGSGSKLQFKSVEALGEDESVDDAMQRVVQYRHRIPQGLRSHAERFGVPRSSANGMGANPNRTYSRADLTIDLPELTVPDYVQAKRRPKDFPDVVLAVREALQDELLAACGTNVEATIPYFGDDDPVVYVYVHRPDKCSDLLLEIRRIEGKWTWDHQFWFEPEARSWTSQQVLRHASTTVRRKP